MKKLLINSLIFLTAGCNVPIDSLTKEAEWFLADVNISYSDLICYKQYTDDAYCIVFTDNEILLRLKCRSDECKIEKCKSDVCVQKTKIERKEIPYVVISDEE